MHALTSELLAEWPTIAALGTIIVLWMTAHHVARRERLAIRKQGRWWVVTEGGRFVAQYAHAEQAGQLVNRIWAYRQKRTPLRG